MKITILKPSDKNALLAFEYQNKVWFEQEVGPRPESFHQLSATEKHISSLLKQHREGKYLPLIVKNSSNNIIARVNISEIDKEKGCADIGYRVAKD
ncbi:GNAT family N-acetyltransferase [Veronia pacifica]|uniref:N-acetyltransferase domain-containing protein n=1 Tax=Veronia pacifica TaxID=1080227 RepID=A0A1C3EQV5_9GAMM|nr:hypothetical protein [Veronia pacifica]ODA35625.1 hypothetical protein A8L45_03125 [Veronia pacifica]